MFLRNHGPLQKLQGIKSHNKDVRPHIPIRKSENTNKIIYQTKSYVNKVKDFTQCDPNEFKKQSANVETATLDNESNNIAKDLIHEILETIPPDAPIDTTELNSVDNTRANVFTLRGCELSGKCVQIGDFVNFSIKCDYNADFLHSK